MSFRAMDSSELVTYASPAANAWLGAHNDKYRPAHHAPALQWDEGAATKAQGWCDILAKERGGSWRIPRRRPSNSSGSAWGTIPTSGRTSP
jgi:hypothetical protein